MKKLILAVLVLAVSAPLLSFQGTGDAPARLPGLYAAVGFGYHAKSDRYYKQVYDSGGINYTADLGYWVIDNLALGIKINYFQRSGETVLSKSQTTLRQIPLIGYIKGGTRIAGHWYGYISGGIGYLLFKEESYMGTVTDSQVGWELESGLEYRFSRKLYLLCALDYRSFRKIFTDLNETQQLGGMGVRLAIGTWIF